MRIIPAALVTLAIIVILGATGRGDYEEAMWQEALYCHMVSVGHWPDFRGTYVLCAPLNLLESPQPTEAEHASEQNHQGVVVDGWQRRDGEPHYSGQPRY